MILEVPACDVIWSGIEAYVVLVAMDLMYRKVPVLLEMADWLMLFNTTMVSEIEVNDV